MLSIKYMRNKLFSCLLIVNIILCVGFCNYLWGDHSDSSDDSKKYLVWSNKCRIHENDPFHRSLRGLIKKEVYTPCSKADPFTYIERNSSYVSLRINETLATKYQGFSCSYKFIYRKMCNNLQITKCDNEITEDALTKFEGSSVILQPSVEVVYVKCLKSVDSFFEKPFYENIHFVIHTDKPNISKHNSIADANKNKLNILIVGIDSVSRLNFYRTMPLMSKYLKQNNWLEMKGYNKMGDNTFPNLMSLLTGMNEQTVHDKCNPRVPYGLDNCSFIWKDFKKAGYITAMGEDRIGISTFNYYKTGFINPPTDYYLRPYMLATEKILSGIYRYAGKYCTGPKVNVERLFDFMVDFSKEFSNQSYFNLIWTNGLSHDDPNAPGVIDQILPQKFQEMEETGTMNNTVIIFLSDHGTRFGPFRDSPLGWYEVRLPFLFIKVPDWFKDVDSNSYKALEVNQNRLTSPYDIYKTLRDIIDPTEVQPLPNDDCETCQSLFKEVPQERSCEEAGISLHWCACSESRELKNSDAIAVRGAETFVNFVNNLIEKVTFPSGRRKCKSVSLKKIHQVKEILTYNSHYKSGTKPLFFVIELTPGNAVYETTILYEASGNYSIQSSDISRINAYGMTSKCITDDSNIVKQYCIC